MGRQKMKYPNLPEDFMSEAKSIREGLGLSLREFAEVSGISASQMSNFETGSRNPSYEACVRIKTALGMEYDLPEPDFTNRVIKRYRSKKGPLITEPFQCVLNGELIEVRSYYKLGSPAIAQRIE
jgi:transcriptional regulator with XRE-family HTH domain